MQSQPMDVVNGSSRWARRCWLVVAVDPPRWVPVTSGANEVRSPPPIDLLVGSLVVHLHHEGARCRASFSGALTVTTQATIDGIADLIAGEQSIVLDFSQVDVVDERGADAVDLLVQSVLARGGELEMSGPRNVHLFRVNSTSL